MGEIITAIEGEEEEQATGQVVRFEAGAGSHKRASWLPPLSGEEGGEEASEQSFEATPAEVPEEVSPEAPVEAAQQAVEQAPVQEAAPEQPEDEIEMTEEEQAAAIHAMIEEARAEGAAAARAEAEREINALRAHTALLEKKAAVLSPLVEELEGLRSRILADSARDIADLSLHVARRVVGETLAVHPESLRTLVTNAIERLPGDDEVSIRLRPEDLPVVEGHLPTRRSITLVPDETLDGGCVVEAQCGEVEASLEVAFVGLRQAVSEWLEDQKR